MRTSAASGQGIEQLKQALQRLCDRAPNRNDTGLFRMAIDRSFTIPGHGTVVTGTVASGNVEVGEDLEWFPAGRTVRVRGLHRHDRPVERLGRGARAAINLGGVHHTEIQRGHELSTPGLPDADANHLGRGARFPGCSAATTAPGAIPAALGHSRGFGHARFACGQRMRIRETRAWPSYSSPSPSWPCMGSRSCSGRKAPRRRWGVVGCSSRWRGAFVGATVLPSTVWPVWPTLTP